MNWETHWETREKRIERLVAAGRLDWMGGVGGCGNMYLDRPWTESVRRFFKRLRRKYG